MRGNLGLLRSTIGATNPQTWRATIKQTLDDLLAPRSVCSREQLRTLRGHAPRTVGLGRGIEPHRGRSPTPTATPDDGAQAAVFTACFLEDGGEQARNDESPAAFVFDHEHDGNGDAV